MQVNDNKAKSFTSDAVISKDGMRIGYQSIGRGPGIIFVQGSMGTIENFTDLARELADSFTVYLPERRGRGISPKVFTEDYSVSKEVEDIEALMNKTKARYIFGLSSGGVISLQAALKLSAIKKIAVYEPALMVDGVPKALDRFKREMASGDISAALVTAMKASEMGPSFLNRMPDWLLVALTKQLLKREDKKAKNDADKFWRNVAPALQFDFKTIEDVSSKWQTLQGVGVDVDVLLLGGSKSPRYLHRALDALEKILPNSRRIELEGLDHGAAWNYHKRQNPRGNPKRVALELRQFFSIV